MSNINLEASESFQETNQKVINKMPELKLIDLNNLSCLTLKSGMKFHSKDWKFEVSNLFFNGSYHTWILKGTSKTETSLGIVEIYPFDVDLIEYITVEKYEYEMPVYLNLSEEEWKHLIELSRPYGWETDHELLIRGAIYYTWSNRIPDHLKRSDKKHVKLLEDHIRFKQGLYDTGNNKRFILKAKSKLSSNLEVADTGLRWKSWVQVSPVQNYGSDLTVDLLSIEGDCYNIPRDSDLTVREYLHRCSSFIDKVNDQSEILVTRESVELLIRDTFIRS
jgi:hypothetical protein